MRTNATDARVKLGRLLDAAQARKPAKITRRGETFVIVVEDDLDELREISRLFGERVLDDRRRAEGAG